MNQTSRGGTYRMPAKALPALLVFILCFAGCREPQSEGTIRLRWVTDINPAREKQIQLFRKSHPHIDVFVDQASGGSTAKVLIQLAAHAGPDLIDIYSPENLAYFAQYDSLLDITDMCSEARIDLDMFWPQCQAWMKHNNRIYGIPTNAGTLVLFYNKDHFDEAGIEYPDETWDWEDYLSAARRLTKRNPDNQRIERYGCYPNEIRPLVWQAGGHFWDENLTTCTLNTPQGIRGLKLFYDTRILLKVAPSLGDEQSFSAGGWGGGVFGSPIPLFATGRVSMLDMGRWGIVTFRQYQKEQKEAGLPPLRFGVAPLPRDATRATWFLSRSTTINAETRYPRECFEFLKFLTTPEYNHLICQAGDGIPSVKSIAESDLFLRDPDYPQEDQNHVYLEDIPYGKVFRVPSDIKAAEYQNLYDITVLRLREGTLTPEEAAEDFTSQVNRAIARNRGQNEI